MPFFLVCKIKEGERESQKDLCLQFHTYNLVLCFDTQRRFPYMNYILVTTISRKMSLALALSSYCMQKIQFNLEESINLKVQNIFKKQKVVAHGSLIIISNRHVLVGITIRKSKIDLNILALSISSSTKVLLMWCRLQATLKSSVACITMAVPV